VLIELDWLKKDANNMFVGNDWLNNLVDEVIKNSNH
jgi:hypothetical protein